MTMMQQTGNLPTSKERERKFAFGMKRREDGSELGSNSYPLHAYDVAHTFVNMSRNLLECTVLGERVCPRLHELSVNQDAILRSPPLWPLLWGRKRKFTS